MCKKFRCVSCLEIQFENSRSYLYYWKGEFKNKLTCICDDCRELLNGGWLGLEDHELEDVYKAVRNGEISSPEDYPYFIKKLRDNNG